MQNVVILFPDRRDAVASARNHKVVALSPIDLQKLTILAKKEDLEHEEVEKVKAIYDAAMSVTLPCVIHKVLIFDFLPKAA